MAKYKSKKIATPDGIFDSKKEYKRWLQLKFLQQAGKIQGLERQKTYTLIEKQVLPFPYQEAGRTHKTIQGIDYKADFYYIKDGQEIVEDVKPTDREGYISKSYKKTAAWREYQIKKKLMLKVHNIQIREV